MDETRWSCGDSASAQDWRYADLCSYSEHSRISAVEPGRSITLTSVRGGVRADYRYAPTPAGAGARTTLTADCEFTGLWRLAAPALRGLIRRRDGGQLTALKRLVESA